ncbi:GyrI-like domain-containing protein [Terribacillus sp. DMT04]|uniref:AraC family transcriptional regulator n=1 Tax=Terribacillus sp. DMT04 TaxID=2850441 RepID=UPI001C2C3C3A|nr:GyrI-like domain-containing protein [Terribacillus sp. DMT04]QXE01076.1 GyrI-like domain-containing protein [Terribacillus sp. DMT04]
MHMQIEVLPSYKVAYIRRVGAYGDANYQTMEELKQWAAAKDLFTGTSIILGISHDDPTSTPPEKCRYDAAIVFADNLENDTIVEAGRTAGGKYACFIVAHTAPAIQQAWSTIAEELLKHKLEADNRPLVERYREELVNRHYCELCIPIK